MESVEMVELGQRSVSDPAAVPEDHEPAPHHLGVIGLVEPAPVLVDEE